LWARCFNGEGIVTAILAGRVLWNFEKEPLMEGSSSVLRGGVRVFKGERKR
jgi:hypothetical protein